MLECGFTGRQIDIALSLAKEDPCMIKKGEKVIDFFVKHCILENGWLYSLYDVKAGRPFASFGDSDAPKLHYMDYPGKRGNYLRTMTEPMWDLLAAYQWYRIQGMEKKEWIGAVRRFAKFLIEKQNKDGSWYRAYTPEGEPVFMNERDEYTEENERGRKASTIIPVMFLCRLAESEPEGKEYLKAARRDTLTEVYRQQNSSSPGIQAKEEAAAGFSSELRNRILAYTDYDNIIRAIYLLDNEGRIYSNLGKRSCTGNMESVLRTSGLRRFPMHIGITEEKVR